jgi:hypothetical protein
LERENIFEDSGFLEMISFAIFELNNNIKEKHLKRLEEFISQTKREREFDKKVMKTITAILNEKEEIDEFLKKYMIFPYKENIVCYPQEEEIETEKVKKILGSEYVKKEEKQTLIEFNKNKNKEHIVIINSNKIKEYIQNKKSEDIFTDIYYYIKENYNVKDEEIFGESLGEFIHFLNKFGNKNVFFTNKANKFGIRIAKWIEQ